LPGKSRHNHAWPATQLDLPVRTARRAWTNSLPSPIFPVSVALPMASGKHLFVTIKDSIENEARPESAARIDLPDYSVWM